MHACMHVYLRKGYVHGKTKKTHTKKKKKSVNGTKEIVQPVDRYHKKKKYDFFVKKYYFNLKI
jgi:hypothetical protein